MSSLTGRFSRHRGWVAAAALFVLYASFLLWKVYSTHDQLRQDVLTELRLDVEKHAETVSYFISERHNDLHDLAESPDVANFFANRDLGMSMEYGLFLSVQAVEDRFNRLKAQKSLGGKAIYRDLALIDADGSLLAGGESADGKLKAFLTPKGLATTIQLAPGGREIVITAPVWIREHYRGQVVAWSDLGSFQTQLVGASDHDGGVVVVEDGSGVPVSAPANSPFRSSALQQALARMQGDSGRTLAAGAGSDVALIKVSVRGAPLALASVVSSTRLAQRETPLGLLVMAGAVPVLVLAGALALARQKQRHLALAAEKGRLEGRNTELEEEIARRLAAERELVEQGEELRHAYGRAEAASLAKSQFLANMAHEIRTPMNGVLGMTELMLHGELSDEQRGYAEIVLSSGQGLLTVLNDILDYSKIDAGKLMVDTLAFNPRETVEQVVALFQQLAEGKGLQYGLSFSENFPATASSDPTRLRQILSNLISNAIKFTSQGSVFVRAETHYRDGRRFLRFMVTDTGIGMDAAALSGLFQAFSQADSSVTRKYGGTGLGLVIARNLCELLGGEISVESEPGRGSVFSVELPSPDSVPGKAEMIADPA